MGDIPLISRPRGNEAPQSGAAAPACKLPKDIHAALVETLFGTVGSLVSGLVGGLLVSALAYGRTREPIFLVSILITVVASVFRVAILIRHGRATADQRHDEAARWERLYALGAVSFMWAVGVTAALLFYYQHDEVATLYGILIAMACVTQLSGRNGGRPATSGLRRRSVRPGRGRRSRRSWGRGGRTPAGDG